MRISLLLIILLFGGATGFGLGGTHAEVWFVLLTSVGLLVAIQVGYFAGVLTTF